MMLASLHQQLVFLLQCSILPEQTYLAGGTAVYFHFRHRLSVDLDFFTEDHFAAERFLAKMRGPFDDVAVESMEQDSLILYLTPEKIKFSLFHYPYPLLSPLVFMPIAEGVSCPLASLKDLAVMKAIAVNQRGSIKDFIDLFYILRREGVTFGDLVHWVIEKYGLDPGYEYHMKTSFVYFDDAEREYDEIVMLEESRDKRRLTAGEWNDVKAFFVEFAG